MAVSTLAACAGDATPRATTAVAASGPLAELAWLSGSWSSTEGDRLVEEHWTTPSTNLLLGVNRTVVNGTTTHHEQLRIEAKDEGVFYVASPSGQVTTAFKMVDHGPLFSVFENPDHDYPKRITYRRAGRSLTVRIEGGRGDRVSEWTWQRTALPSD